MNKNKYLWDNRHLPYRVLAEATGLSKDAVESRIRRMRNKGGFASEEEVSPSDARSLDSFFEKHKRERRVSDKKYRVALGEIARLEAERDAVLAINKTPQTYRLRPVKDSVGGEAVAVMVASDWHVEEFVDEKTVSGMNQYNLDIAKNRSETFFRRAVRLIRKEQKDVDINTSILALLGD